jgi:hypothetical protein
MDRGHFSDENTASVRNRVPTLVPPDGRSVGLDHLPTSPKVLCRGRRRARDGV